MRTAIAAALMLIVVPAMAEDAPSQDIRAALRMVAMVGTAEGACPAYRANTIQMMEISKSFGLDPNDIQSKYKDFWVKTLAEMKDAVDKSRDNFCNISWDIFGDHGKVPNVLEKK